ncbi:MAG TPA: hypothetical protein VG329_04080 [Candidatus Dormibacteraeota bacterium]|jgi:hypothetical protein|nr:hypothetical protein [Candidatus Dormibacteraeota bacterium]
MAPTGFVATAPDCLRWNRAAWEPVRWPRATWPVAPQRRAGWTPAEMPCEWPAVQGPLLRWGTRPWSALRSPWPGGMGVVVVV